MITDQQGNRLSGATTEAANFFNEAVASFNIYRGDPVSLIDSAIATAPNFTMAHIFKAYLLGLATEPGLTGQATDIIRELKTTRLEDREASHVHALDGLLSGQWTQTAHVLNMHNSCYPLDIVALQCGHLVDFYSANARNLRDRMARVLPQWSPELPGYPVLLGMYAFGLEEAGDYERAEENGRYAIELEPLDCWAHHAVAHVLEMQGRAHDGIKWMTTNDPCWTGSDNFLKVHNWWHHAVYHLEIGNENEALAIYDTQIRKDCSTVALELVDASAMLWRLHLAGIDVADRWLEVASCWEPHADGHSYPFNDWHAVMAYLGAGRDGDVERILEALRQSSSQQTELGEWARRYALPLCLGFTAFWRQDYLTAVEFLHGARSIANGFGGSHAQRDIIDLTLLEAALRSGNMNLAKSLANERLALKPTSRLNRDFLARSKC